MHDVRELKLGVPCKTRLWLSQRVIDAVREFNGEA